MRSPSCRPDPLDIRGALLLPSDAATNRCPDAGDSRDRRRWRGRSDRSSCRDPCASTRPSLVRPSLRRGPTAPSGARSASVSAPVRNSHSARFSSSAKFSSCRRAQPSSAQQRRAGDEIRERRGVGRRSLGALPGDQIELGESLTFVSRGDQRHATVELIDDFEDRLLPLLRQACAPPAAGRFEGGSPPRSSSGISE